MLCVSALPSPHEPAWGRPPSGKGDRGRLATRLRPHSGGKGQDHMQGTVYWPEVSRTPTADGELCKLNSKPELQNIQICNLFSKEKHSRNQQAEPGVTLKFLQPKN